MKYKVQVGSFCTRFIQRNITVHAKDEIEASDKAIEKFIHEEYKLKSSNDVGTPQVDLVDIVE